jgi:hypothetical protein
LDGEDLIDWIKKVFEKGMPNPDNGGPDVDKRIALRHLKSRHLHLSPTRRFGGQAAGLVEPTNDSDLYHRTLR